MAILKEYKTYFEYCARVLMTSISCLILIQKDSIWDMMASSSVIGTPCPWTSANRDDSPFLGDDPVTLEVPLVILDLKIKCI